MMEDTPGLLKLPDESLISILGYLHYKDLVRVCCTCRRLREISADDCLWNWQCQHYFLDNECSKELSWRQHFINLYRQYGKYADYIPIRQAWNKIEKSLKKPSPRILASLQDGLSEEQLDEIEGQIGHALPLDLRLSYRIHNGQAFHPNGPGLMGGGTISSHVRSDRLVPADRMMYSYETNPEHHLAGCALLAMTSTDIQQMIAISDLGGYTPGTIFTPVLYSDDDVFISATSFKDWLCEHADNLEKNAYYINNQFIFKFYHEPSCVAVSHWITVKPTTCFISELSRPKEPTFFFSYRIILEMAEDAPASGTCRLMTRHWRITDGNGKVEHVDGPGVVGYHPVMKPGSKFDWISCCTFETPEGSMGGHFKFTNLQTGAVIEVECPTYYMKAQPVFTKEERLLRVQAREQEQKELLKSNTQPL